MPKLIKLKNGVSVILIPKPGSSVTIDVLCQVGSRYEKKEINGISHFNEHMTFKGTKRWPTAQHLSRELDRYGAYYNAFTSKDRTAYYIKIDAKHIAQAIDLLYDMVFQPRYEAKDLERERGVIIEEINMYEDNPQMRIDMLLEKAMYPHSSLGWGIAGPRSVIQTISRSELINYRDAYYIPERTCVVVSGEIPKNIHALLKKTFGSVKPPKKRRDTDYAKIASKDIVGGVLEYEEKKTEQTQLGLGFSGFTVSDPREPAAKLLSVILGGYMSSRLFTEVREKKGLCYSISAGHDAFGDVGMFSVFAGLDRTRLPLAMTTILKEFDRMKRTGPTEEELIRAKDHLRGTLALGFEDSAFQAGWYGSDWVLSLPLQTPEARIAELTAVKASDVRDAAREILRTDRMNAAVIGPHGKKLSISHLMEGKLRNGR
jgi:predicted Zn-dependent peptidase